VRCVCSMSETSFVFAIAGNTPLSKIPRALFTWQRLGCREVKLEAIKGGHSVSPLSPAARRRDSGNGEDAGMMRRLMDWLVPDHALKLTNVHGSRERC